MEAIFKKFSKYSSGIPLIFSFSVIIYAFSSMIFFFRKINVHRAGSDDTFQNNLKKNTEIFHKVNAVKSIQFNGIKI